MRVLYASSSVGLGHVTRDYHIRKNINGNVEWLTSGNALKYLKERGENINEISNSLYSLGDYIEKMIKNCEVKINPIDAYRLYKAVKHNAELITNEINFDDYDLIIADEFWEFMFVNIPKERSVFLTDFTKVNVKSNSYFEKLIIPRLNLGLINRINEKFSLKINLSLWDKDKNFINLGPAFSDDYFKVDTNEGDYILVNIGGTNAGLKVAEKLKEKMKEYDVKIIGSSKYFDPNPKKLIKDAGIIISLSGYGSVVESNALKKKTIFLFIENHFEHIENANIMRNRKGFRVYPCNKILDIDIKNEIEHLKKEDIDPLEINDSSYKVVEEIKKFIS